MSSSMEVDGEPMPQVERKVCDNEVIHKTIQLIMKGTESAQPRLISRAIRQNVAIRKYAAPAQLTMILDKYVPANLSSSQAMKDLIVKITEASEKAGENEIDEVTEKEKEDSAMDITEGKGESATKDEENPTEPSVPPTSILPEVEVYIFTLLVSTLLRYQLVNEACMASAVLIQRLGQFNRRSLDQISSKAYSYVQYNNQLQFILTGKQAINTHILTPLCIYQPYLPYQCQ